MKQLTYLKTQLYQKGICIFTSLSYMQQDYKEVVVQGNASLYFDIYGLNQGEPTLTQRVIN